jgi:hypothetical protein
MVGVMAGITAARLEADAGHGGTAGSGCRSGTGARCAVWTGMELSSHWRLASPAVVAENRCPRVGNPNLGSGEKFRFKPKKFRYRYPFK